MRKAVTVLIIFCITVVFTACESKREDPLTIGMCPWPGYEPIPLAQKLGFFKKPIKIIRYSSPHEAYKAFKNGAIDLVALTIDELLKLGDSGMVPKVFLITDISKGADALVAHPSIKSIDALKGKTIGLESSILAQYFLQRILDHSSNLKIEDISVKTVDIVKQHQAYLDTQADAFITFEPAKSALVKSGAQVLFDSSMIPNEILDAVATQDDVLQNRLNDIKMFVQGWYQAMDYIKMYPEQAYAQMADMENISKEVFEKSLMGLEYGTRALNKKLIEDRGIVPALSRLKSIMTKNTLIKENNQSIESLLGTL